ncbi:MAG: hypothetical protein GY796_08970 [Chloroflexi bacterium]|nr:hypothetical protein [Chloroflexota bacterium]
MDSATPALPFDSNDEPVSDQQASGKSTTPGRQEEIKWKVVAEAPGITPATIIANRLHAEGIPARAWQEGAGQALGLTIGLLGTGHVAVPEEYEEQALDILNQDAEVFDEDDE